MISTIFEYPLIDLSSKQYYYISENDVRNDHTPKVGQLYMLDGEMSMVTDAGDFVSANYNVHASIDQDLIDVIDWAKKKMKEEEQLEELMKEYPSLEEAWNHFNLVKSMVDSET